jgi:hypothetical protein
MTVQTPVASRASRRRVAAPPAAAGAELEATGRSRPWPPASASRALALARALAELGTVLARLRRLLFDAGRAGRGEAARARRIEFNRRRARCRPSCCSSPRPSRSRSTARWSTTPCASGCRLCIQVCPKRVYSDDGFGKPDEQRRDEECTGNIAVRAVHLHLPASAPSRWRWPNRLYESTLFVELPNPVRRGRRRQPAAGGLRGGQPARRVGGTDFRSLRRRGPEGGQPGARRGRLLSAHRDHGRRRPFRRQPRSGRRARTLGARERPRAGAGAPRRAHRLPGAAVAVRSHAGPVRLRRHPARGHRRGAACRHRDRLGRRAPAPRRADRPGARQPGLPGRQAPPDRRPAAAGHVDRLEDALRQRGAGVHAAGRNASGRNARSASPTARRAAAARPRPSASCRWCRPGAMPALRARPARLAPEGRRQPCRDRRHGRPLRSAALRLRGRSGLLQVLRHLHLLLPARTSSRARRASSTWEIRNQ